MNNYGDIALKLERYFEPHLANHPEWEGALDLVRDWKAAMRSALSRMQRMLPE